MLYKFFSLVFLVCLAWPAFAQQKPPTTEEEYEKAFEWRIRQDMLNGVYIPKDLGEVFTELNRLINADSKQKFKSAAEEVAARKLHFSLGRWMIVNWGFYEGSRLSEYLRKSGLTYPDDMARFLIISYHRYLNKKDLQVKEQIAAFQEMRKKEYEAERLKGELIHEETRQRERPDSTRQKQ